MWIEKQLLSFHTDNGSEMMCQFRLFVYWKKFTLIDILACLLDTLAVVVDVEIPDTINHVVLGHYMDVVHIVPIHLNPNQDIVVNLVQSFAKQLR